ncbi:Uncharacterized protein BM_BM17473 [Brugia malayi]|uniref:Transthyretin-like family protein n=2 Tax=Brugia TaxID=6278 RepID=A0A4E9FAF2_BRUMA|nr:Uncharacterized protein BM_BM17473 [Brugia malayi]VDN93795.1 unnamed protein product [Brugia pahangi]VIO93043.1 Uncharacterized protein BM_BM17473 [Brugia malayi]
MNSSTLLLLLALLLVVSLPVAKLASLFHPGTEQSVAVKGKLLCNGEPAANIKVKLYDVDVGLDDLMAQGRTDKNGEFSLNGTETEITPIDPKLNIYHNCNDGHKDCSRKVSIKIPKSSIVEGEKAGEAFDIGVLNLSSKFPGETRDCIN